ncbi:myo-inosose-2 dehydratase [Lihuaxuella thermophila]|uniref:Inosose dehydratase n=1 Tax=Lihuaxuella thermophila TaxID=1173111 RepID=A0A1H8EM08_9BACL|nr:myo-inosose-2 dehydratase [Lihuaxuella thermophila]SEN19897.1 inosose dehydratase [Lihuaxuella thermophila]
MSVNQTETRHFRIGIAPISWVNDDIPGLGDHYTQDQVLSEMSSLGYVSTEMGRLFMQDPPSLKAKLDEYGIQLASKFVGTLFSDATRLDEELQSFHEWVNYLREMGCKHVIVCEMGGSMHWDPRRSQEEMTVQKLTDSEWKSLVNGLHRAAKLCRENGMELVYHFHAGTVVETREEIDRLMELTDPDLVHLLYDTGHALYGGYDPLELLTKYYDRIQYVHLKNVRHDVLEYVRKENLDFRTAVLKGLFTVPGDPQGCIDFKPIFKELIERGYDGWWIVEAEQDPAIADPYKYAKMAKEYIEATVMSIQSANQTSGRRENRE